MFSCGKTSYQEGIANDTTENIVIDLDRNTKLPYDSLFAKIEFIKLETNEQNLIGRISQILFVDSLIVIVDSENTKSINIFDLEGKWKCGVGLTGNGPDEYVEISNVVIVPEKKWICILDRPQKKILYFDLNGKFISSERQSFMLDYFEYIDVNHKAFNVIGMYDYAYGNHKGNALIVTGLTDNILYGAFKDTYHVDFDFVINRPLKKFSEQVYFSPNFSDSIFIVENDKVIPKYYIDIRTNGISKSDKKNLTNKKLYDLRSRCFYFNGDFIETNDFTFINIATPWGYPFAIYSHEIHDVFLTTGEFTNPLYTFCTSEPIARFKENEVVFPVDAYVIYNSKDALYTIKEYKSVLDELYKDLDVNSNPILLICQININLGKQ